MVEIKPNDFIQTIRETDVYIEKIYLNGGCYSFYKVLKVIFPTAIPLINHSKDHIITMIDDKGYDITGQVEGSYSMLTKEEILMCEKWSFSRNYWLHRECPNCEELID